MVDEEAVGGVGKDAVHRNLFSAGASTGVKIVTASGGGPFVFGQPWVIFGVHNREFALG